MRYNPREHHRRSIRLPGYDYRSPGAYFVTICTRQGECLLGEIVDGEMGLSQFGQVAHDVWRHVPVHFPNLLIDAWVVMPNHLHAIVVIQPASTVAGGEDQEGEETSPLRDGPDGGRGAVAAPRGANAMARNAPRDMEAGPETVQGERENRGRGAVAAPTGVAVSSRQSRIERPALGQIVAYYKYNTTKQINQLRDLPGVPVWQRNYWEHIIRNEESLERIREYIENNPARWAEDQLHPGAPPNPFKQ